MSRWCVKVAVSGWSFVRGVFGVVYEGWCVRVVCQGWCVRVGVLARYRDVFQGWCNMVVCQGWCNKVVF